MDNVLENLNSRAPLDGAAALDCLPRVRALHASDKPHAWVVVDGEPMADSVPDEVSRAVELLRKHASDSIVSAPALTTEGQWVVLVSPDADTRTGHPAFLRAHTAAGRQMRSQSIRNVVIGTQSLPDTLVMDQAQGLRLGWYRDPSRSSPQPPEILIASTDGYPTEHMVKAEVFSQATCLTRYWTEQPPNKLTPAALAQIAKQLGQTVGLDVEVLGVQEMRDMGMGGVLAVGEGSTNSPRLVILRHRSDEAPAYGVVGKGITFDSGGISLKPPKNMRKLKGDKAGASAVLAASLAAAQMRLPTPFIAVLPFAENLPSKTAYRPGDVITMLNGTTVDVVSTDAEGRMLLADGMALACRRGCPRIISIATLTRASMVALGNFRAALYSSDDGFANDMVRASERVGEFVWRMPLDEDYNHMLKSPVADVLNSGQTGTGGSIIAAKFLQRFTQDIPWAHLDMSPIFFLDQEMPWGDKGYTGAGARLLLSLLEGSNSDSD